VSKSEEEVSKSDELIIQLTPEMREQLSFLAKREDRSIPELARRRTRGAV